MSFESLLPNGGVENFGVYGDKIDNFQNRWNRHFHTLYGYSQFQNENSFFEFPIDKIKENPYWTITKNALEGHGGNYLGLFDLANPFEWLSILAIETRLAMVLASDAMLTEAGSASSQNAESNSAMWSKIGGHLLRAAAFMFDLLVRFPLGVAATLTCHVFDITKALTALMVATVTATVSQAAAEIGFATGLNEALDGRKGYATV